MRRLMWVAWFGAMACGDAKTEGIKAPTQNPPPPPAEAKPLPPAPSQPPPLHASPPRVPAELATFLREHKSGAARWKVTVHELGDKGRGFLGHVVKHTSELDERVTDELIAMLERGDSFDEKAYGGIGCTSNAIGLRLARDGATFDLLFDSAWFVLREDGPPIAVSRNVCALMYKVEAWALPCAPLVIDSLDVEICAPRGARFAGGPPSHRLISIPMGPCQQLTVGTARADDKYMRKVGTFELSCHHNDEPACIKVCETLRPLPNSTATKPFPAGEPVIETSLSGTWIPLRGVQIWADGTITFAGPRCKKVRGQRAKVTAQQVTKLLDDITATGFLGAKPPPPGDVVDAGILRLRVTAAGKTNAMRLGGGEKSAELAASRQLIEKLVGKNPCI